MAKHGCSIVSDAWTDREQRSIINFLVSFPTGTMFLSSIDACDVVKSGDPLCGLFDVVVEEVGEDRLYYLISCKCFTYI